MKRKRTDEPPVGIPELLAAIQIPVLDRSYYNFLNGYVASLHLHISHTVLTARLHSNTVSDPTSFLKLKDHFLTVWPSVGNRPDTHCPNCLMFGHDHRCKACFLLQARETLADNAIVYSREMHEHLRTMATVAAFNECLPDEWKQFAKEPAAIRNFFRAIEIKYRNFNPSENTTPAAAVPIPAQKKQRTITPAVATTTTAPAGASSATGTGKKYTVVDISRMDGDMIADLTDFFLDVDLDNGVAIDHSRLKPAQFRKIIPFLVR